ncbi:unnamed protein product, partial [Amoebophrya sp. A25]|eukprot:GSA25T00015803001.1
MQVVGYSQLFANEDLGHFLSPVDDPIVRALADFENYSPSELLHQFSLRKNVAVIPKSTNEKRIRENAMKRVWRTRQSTSTSTSTGISISDTSFRILDALVVLWESILIPGEEIVQPSWARSRLDFLLPKRQMTVLSGKIRNNLAVLKELAGVEVDKELASCSTGETEVSYTSLVKELFFAEDDVDTHSSTWSSISSA